MIPVFQESYIPIPLDKAPTPHIKALLEHDGVQVFDLKDVRVSPAIEALAQMVENAAAWRKQAPPDMPFVAAVVVNIDSLTGPKSANMKSAICSAWAGWAHVARMAILWAQCRTLKCCLQHSRDGHYRAVCARGANGCRIGTCAHRPGVRIWDAERPEFFVVMRLLTGGSLADRLSRKAKIGDGFHHGRECAQVIHDLANALDYAHSRG